MPEPYVERVLIGQRSHEHINPHAIGGLSLRDERRTAMFFPSEHITLVGGERIISVIPLGYQPIIDAHVPGTNCYLIGGSVHHNTGKTVAGGYECTAHMTGQYPDWWEGKRFRHPIDAWAAGDTNETTRDVIQKELFGQVTWNSEGRKTMDGSGIVPRETFGRITWKQGVQDMIDTIQIRHVSGGWSRLGLKSFDQGRRVFQGTAKHLIWLDEECPKDVYDECLTRTGTTAGILLTTFTPLNGRTEVVKSFDMQRAA
ncbi:terminase family protein [Sphingobium phenoxybenzoativorans]|uniref:Terminase family protein n=2 Tax=Sphingobium phenoxybenzoativorans TaxID=1592790 RepID=A0A975PZP6_9SPHN|nr:terminase family protein [Sphingobium phenoxybenzoativorans]